MEIVVASTIGALTAAGVYLILRRRTFAVVLGTAMLSYAINVFLFASGRLMVNAPPLLGGQVPGQLTYSDPLPQALVLTAIVISFGMTAVAVMMALGAFIENGDDRVDMPRADRFGPRPSDADAEERDPARALPSETDREAKRARQHMHARPEDMPEGSPQTPTEAQADTPEEGTPGDGPSSGDDPGEPPEDWADTDTDTDSDTDTTAEGGASGKTEGQKGTSA